MAQQMHARNILYQLVARFADLPTAGRNRIIIRDFRGEEFTVLYDARRMLFLIGTGTSTAANTSEREVNEFFARMPLKAITTAGFAKRASHVMIKRTAFALEDKRLEEPVPSILYAYGMRTGADDSMQGFLAMRTRKSAPNEQKYSIDDYVDPIKLDEVANRRNAYFIQENVGTDGRIRGLYDPDSLHQWFGVQERLDSPATRRRVERRFVKLPPYLLG
jgi:hypothetical protein